MARLLCRVKSWTATSPPAGPTYLPLPCGQVALLRQELDGHFFVTCEQVLRVMDCFEVGRLLLMLGWAKV